jgi:hypothetical protein
MLGVSAVRLVLGTPNREIDLNAEPDPTAYMLLEI